MLNTVCITMSTATAGDVYIIMSATGQVKEWELAVLTWLFFKSEKGHKYGAVQAEKSQGFSSIFLLNRFLELLVPVVYKCAITY